MNIFIGDFNFDCGKYIDFTRKYQGHSFET
jgi:hypothetical protein